MSMPEPGTPPGTLSPDGRWRWDGARWVPNAAARPTGAGRQRPPFATLAVIAAVVLIGVMIIGGFVAYLQFGVSHGRHATLAHPCALLSEQTVRTMLPGAGTPHEVGGDVATCEWKDNSGESPGELYLDLTCFSSRWFVPAEDDAHTFYEQTTRGLAGDHVANVGDEAVSTRGEINARSDNVVWNINAPTVGDQNLIQSAAREVARNLGG